MAENANSAEDERFQRGRSQALLWLQADRYKVESMEPRGDLAWIVRGIEPGYNHTVLVGQMNGQPDEIIISARVDLSQDQASRAAGLEEGELRGLWTSIALSLIHLTLNFSGLSTPFTMVDVQTSVFLDGLNKNEFLGAVRRVKAGCLAAIWLLAGRLGQPPPPSTSSALVH